LKARGSKGDSGNFPNKTRFPERLGFKSPSRFKQELILARKVTHKNVIRIFDLGQASGIRFITMEYIEGQDLRSLVRTTGKPTPEESVNITQQVCLALEAAHARESSTET
jgi:serine/threonine protein kinase